MEKNKFTVACVACGHVAGTVKEVEARPGFFINQSTPDILPKHCPVCLGVLTRREV